MITNLTQTQIENVQAEAGILFINYGETDETCLGPTRGGAEFGVSNNYRYVDYDGMAGESDIQVLDTQSATLKVTTLDASQDTLKKALPGCVATTSEGATTLKNGDNGLISAATYIKNITLFAPLLSGKFKKITLYNVINKSSLSLKAASKAEGEIALEFHAHFKATDSTALIWKIEDVIAPITHMLTINVNSQATAVGVTVTNAAGTTVFEESTTEANEVIRIDLPNGTYTVTAALSLDTDTQTVTIANSPASVTVFAEQE